MNLPIWTERARQAQSRIRRKARPARQTFIIFARDLPKLRQTVGRKLAALLTVEELPHLHDVDECGRW